MSIRIEEPIQVTAVFQRGQVTPVWFIWGRRKYAVKEVTMRWLTRQGREPILHLAAVTAQGNTFELTFNQHTLSWHMAQAAGGEAA